ncbi:MULTISPECIES: hypothetical protein [Prochlorococcus]|nr:MULTISPECIES: hypothetical protein [Prochlorococcus]KGG20493.1 hypothetical protein EV08_1078 [Prochlorococcus marinus str. SS2]KGG24158.1 hypothetical protein EV09_0764 [Prochlorococcus marinus str. SS35]KGG10909.1 hypothetical protein EV04_1872 [Prochlorococcus marinus str. LG]KGG31584.1 hypothetical protein EV10_1678 [Prochlorococcus marinus str. SS51]KGG34650.1 hypothetical protein EV11_1780 [Prochlorococcus sp. SS52]
MLSTSTRIRVQGIINRLEKMEEAKQVFCELERPKKSPYKLTDVPPN